MHTDLCRDSLVTLCASVWLLSGCVEDVAAPNDTAHDPNAWFVDAAPASGLTMRHALDAPEEHLFPEIMTGGAGAFDYDRDGDLDLFLTLSPEAGGGRLYRNELIPDGSLRFVDVTGDSDLDIDGYPMGIAAGDYDNDGFVDVFVTNYADSQLFRNEGDGSFVNVTEASGIGSGRWSTSASFFDYDRDGDLDLYVAHYVDSDAANDLPCRGPLGVADFCSPAAYQPVQDRLYRNDGNGRFTDATAQAGFGAASGSGLGVATADFDQDGWPDLYVANDGNANQLWMNQRDGTFQDEALLAGAAYNDAGQAEAGMGIAVGDIDGDGDEDLLVTHLEGETNTLYLNDGSAFFHDATRQFGISFSGLSATGFGTAMFDYDGDGLLDLYIANGAVQAARDSTAAFPYGQRDILLHNDGAGFSDVSGDAGVALDEERVGRAVASGDFDNDGDVDLLVANIAGSPQLLLNNRQTPGSWLRLRLVGTTSNRDAIGARVLIAFDDDTRVFRYVRRDGSYLAANDPRIHVAVPSERTVVTIDVRWPNGADETWPAPELNREIELREGSSKQ